MCNAELYLFYMDEFLVVLLSEGSRTTWVVHFFIFWIVFIIA